MSPLAPRQQVIYDFLKLYMGEHGRPPTRQEIAEAFGFQSANAAQCHLKVLASKGYIRLIPNISRGIALVR